MRYIPVLPRDREEMLKQIGVSSIEDLFSSVPDDVRIKRSLDLPKRLSELELSRFFDDIVAKNDKPATSRRWNSFLGAGSYEHYVPSAVDHLVSRSEFYTAYTPYQAELSQGTLQSIFEFQSLICSITGMDVTNASMYDGASSLAEACLMASRIKKKNGVLIANSVHPEYRQVVETYTSQKGLKLINIPFTSEGLCDLKSVDAEDVACVVLQYPNFLGIIDDMKGAKELSQKLDALFLIASTEPLSFGVYKSPGELGCDIFAAEAQSFGNSMSFGGPHLGILAAKREFIRNMPGRIVSKTKDAEGKEGYVLYLATREQHIRREKATSNICTNNALCALKATIYLSLLGQNGFKALAARNLYNANYLKSKLEGLRGVQIRFEGPIFNEFVFSTAHPASTILEKLKEDGIIGGIPLGIYFNEYETGILVTATEMKSKKQMDDFAESLKKCL